MLNEKEDYSVAFIICTEAGKLEKKSRLFVESLRNFGGILAKTNVYSISPREKKSQLSERTRTFFKEQNVIHEAVNVNSKYPDYSMANKIYSAAYYENKLTEDLLVFCDSDLLILNSLDELLIPKSKDVAFRVVARKNVGSDGKDTNADYWKSLYKILGVNKISFVTTALGERIFSYFDGGLIVAKKKIGFFNQWKENFEKVMKCGLEPDQGIYFLEQTLIGATYSQMDLNAKKLPISYNYPLLRHHDLLSLGLHLSIQEINMLHYHRAFDAPKSINVAEHLKGFSGPKLKWIEEYLIKHEINPSPFKRDLHYKFLLEKESIKKTMMRNKNQKLN